MKSILRFTICQKFNKKQKNLTYQFERKSLGTSQLPIYKCD